MFASFEHEVAALSLQYHSTKSTPAKSIVSNQTAIKPQHIRHIQQTTDMSETARVSLRQHATTPHADTQTHSIQRPTYSEDVTTSQQLPRVNITWQNIVDHSQTPYPNRLKLSPYTPLQPSKPKHLLDPMGYRPEDTWIRRQAQGSLSLSTIARIPGKPLTLASLAYRPTCTSPRLLTSVARQGHPEPVPTKKEPSPPSFPVRSNPLYPRSTVVSCSSPHTQTSSSRTLPPSSHSPIHASPAHLPISSSLASLLPSLAEVSTARFCPSPTASSTSSTLLPHTILHDDPNTESIDSSRKCHTNDSLNDDDCEEDEGDVRMGSFDEDPDRGACNGKKDGGDNNEANDQAEAVTKQSGTQDDNVDPHEDVSLTKGDHALRDIDLTALTTYSSEDLLSPSRSNGEVFITTPRQPLESTRSTMSTTSLGSVDLESEELPVEIKIAKLRAYNAALKVERNDAILARRRAEEECRRALRCCAEMKSTLRTIKEKSVEAEGEIQMLRQRYHETEEMLERTRETITMLEEDIETLSQHIEKNEAEQRHIEGKSMPKTRTSQASSPSPPNETALLGNRLTAHSREFARQRAINDVVSNIMLEGWAAGNRALRNRLTEVVGKERDIVEDRVTPIVHTSSGLNMNDSPSEDHGFDSHHAVDREDVTHHDGLSDRHCHYSKESHDSDDYSMDEFD